MDLADFRRVVIDPNCSSADVERCFHAVEDTVPTTICQGDRSALMQLDQTLRRIYEILAVDAPDDYMANPLCRLGRVAGLVEVVGFAIERSHPSEVVQLLRREGGLALLVRLDEKGRSGRALMDWFGWDRNRFDQQLAQLEAFGLVTVRLYHEDERWVVLTNRGRQALRDFDE